MQSVKSLFDPILLDLDGTLIDSGKDIAVSINRTLSQLDLTPLPEDQIIGYVGNGVRELLRRTLQQHARIGSRSLIQAEDSNLLDRAVQIFKDDYGQNCLVHTKPYPKIMELLADLAGRQVGAVTNKRSDFTKIILDGLGMSPYLGTVVSGDETDRLKPHPEPLLLACQRLNITPDNGIMVGDMETDMQSGRRAGMSVCGVMWGLDRGKSVRASRPDFICTSVSELRTILTTLKIAPMLFDKAAFPLLP